MGEPLNWLWVLIRIKNGEQKNGQNNNSNSDKAHFVDNDRMPSDHYVWLTGLGAKMLRKEIPVDFEMPDRVKTNR